MVARRPFGVPRLEAKDVPIKAEGGVDGRHGDPIWRRGCVIGHDARQHNDCTRGSEGYGSGNFTAVTDATFGLEVEQHQGSRSWTSGRRVRAVSHGAPILDQLAGEYQGS